MSPAIGIGHGRKQITDLFCQRSEWKGDETGTTSVNLWRSIRKEQFPEGPIKEDKPVQGVLYPDFEAREIKPGEFCRPDVIVDAKTGFVNLGDGTSLFDKSKAFRGKMWFKFWIPEGTEYPETLKVVKTNDDERFKANHYQIEAAHKEIPVDTFKGALDNSARAAIVKQCELAK